MIGVAPGAAPAPESPPTAGRLLMSATEGPVGRLVESLHLEELVGEGGWYRRTLDAPEQSTMLYLVGEDAFAAIHTLTVEEEYRFVAGSPLRLLLLDDAGPREEIVSGEHPTVTVPAGCWQGSSAASGWSLVTATVRPRFEESMVTLGERDELRRRYPLVARRIERLTR
jgi:predicted cupin superfamily sugar epimerase